MNVLRVLAQACQTASDRFRVCAEVADSADVKALLTRRGLEYLAAANELQAHQQRLEAMPGGISTDETGAVVGWAPPGGLTGFSELALIEECERGEDTVLEAFADALALPLEPAVKEVTERQRLEAKNGHSQVRTLRDRVRAAA
ncbi:MAG: PA2169 family four-helix-bundle protein [Pseudomonadota bacterium]